MENKTKHTPGKWKWVTETHGAYLRSEDGEDIADDGSASGEYGRIIEPDSPNARLIAAAPELLAALESCADLLAAQYPTRERAERLLVSVRAAIAKAKGEL